MNLPPLVRMVLWPLSLVYGQLMRLRVALYERGLLKQKRLNRPVISVGNLTVGGTGKTPMVIWLAERLLAQGLRVGILSRGYKGSGGTSDEIELMKLRLNNRVAFGVGPDRFEQGRRIEASADVFLLDDGFQHRQLSRDVDILLIDAARSLGKEVMLPTGRLREPVSAMSRADFLLFTRTETVPGTMEAITKLQQYPVFSAATQLVGFRLLGERIQFVPADEIDAGPFYAFCGIGNPRAFFLNLQNWGIAVAGKCEFGDHHRYDERDVRELVAAARRMGARALVTTEKDEQNLSGEKFEGLPVYVAVIDLAIDKEEVFLQAIREKLDARNSVA
jgi:tetraacyldisaccharide 4'-kinase